MPGKYKEWARDEKKLAKDWRLARELFIRVPTYSSMLLSILLKNYFLLVGFFHMVGWFLLDHQMLDFNLFVNVYILIFFYDGLRAVHSYVKWKGRV